jgi:hypothetical protein
MRPIHVIAAMAVLLVGLAIFMPTNTLTGNVIVEGPCQGLGCVELCDVGADVCAKGLSCCPTQWETGVCDYSTNCERIREYSLYQTLETYQDGVREKPAPVQLDFQRFVVPLAIITIIIGYFAFKRRQPDLR